MMANDINSVAKPEFEPSFSATLLLNANERKEYVVNTLKHIAKKYMK